MASDIINFYNGKTVFITGGTGFLGVCLIEKLLRCVPDLKNIYLLMRPKKGKQIEERLEELKKNSVFNRLKEENKLDDLFKKLIPVAGDVGQENLGLSSADRLTLVEDVQIVFHSAATLDFDADLKSTTNINLLGTRRVVELCQEIRDLKVLVHVSSAYVNSVLHEVDERVYPAPFDVKELLRVVEKLDDKTLDAETPNILKDHPNSYTFTKHLAEHEVKNGHVPAAIVRPSMITGAWKEPIPGWTISKNGPQGFLMGASKGVIRRLPVAKNLIYDYIPVDIVVNNLIVAGYAVNRDGGKELKVYHCTSSTCNPFKWETVESKINGYLHMYPLRSAVWYPHLKLISSIFLFRLYAYCLNDVSHVYVTAVIKVLRQFWSRDGPLTRFSLNPYAIIKGQGNQQTLEGKRQIKDVYLNTESTPTKTIEIPLSRYERSFVASRTLQIIITANLPLHRSCYETDGPKKRKTMKGTSSPRHDAFHDPVGRTQRHTGIEGQRTQGNDPEDTGKTMTPGSTSLACAGSLAATSTMIQKQPRVVRR